MIYREMGEIPDSDLGLLFRLLKANKPVFFNATLEEVQTEISERVECRREALREDCEGSE